MGVNDPRMRDRGEQLLSFEFIVKRNISEVTYNLLILQLEDPANRSGSRYARYAGY